MSSIRASRLDRPWSGCVGWMWAADCGTPRRPLQVNQAAAAARAGLRGTRLRRRSHRRRPEPASRCPRWAVLDSRRRPRGLSGASTGLIRQDFQGKPAWPVAATRPARSCSRWAPISRSPSPRASRRRSSPAPARCWPKTVHSLADCGNQVLLLLGHEAGQAPPSPDYPLGYGKAIYFWSFLVARDAVHRRRHVLAVRGLAQAAAPRADAAVVVGGRRADVRHRRRGVSMRACLRRSTRRAASAACGSWFRESRQAELVVIFGEDLAALLGLVFALIAVVAGRGHRQPGLGRDRHARDRRAADRGRGVRRDRGQGDADRPERGPEQRAGRSSSSSTAARRSSACST